MKQTLKRTIIAGAVLGLLLSPVVVSARGGEIEDNEVHAETSSPSPSAEPSETPRPERVRKFEENLRKQLEEKRHAREAANENEREEIKTRLAEKLDDAKKKACMNHEATINRIMTLIDKRRENSLDRISQIATAVQNFYVKKQLSVANYDDLVANVAAAKTVAEQAVSQQKAIPELKCDGEHPRADVTEFKAKKDAAKDAVKAYRDAVKALVKAVKAAAEKTEETTSPSPSPEVQQ